MELIVLRTEHRAALDSLLRATGSFSAEEVNVALGLFDESMTVGPDRTVDYEFIGALHRDGSLLGYACFGPTPSARGTYDLYWLAVHPSAQRGGVGRALVAHVERHLRRRGARLLVVETSSREDYDAPRRFYASAGYLESARLRDFYAPGNDRIILTMDLSQPEAGVATP